MRDIKQLQQVVALLTQFMDTPSRALDWAVHCRNGMDGVGAYGTHPAYTGSVDAALTLVAVECYAKGPAGAAVGPRCLWEIWQVAGDACGKIADGVGGSPAMAVCIGSLNAEIHMMEATNEHEQSDSDRL